MNNLWKDPDVAVTNNEDIYDLWDRGLFVLGSNEGKLYNIPSGEKIGTAMAEWTVCPIGNGTCQEAVMVEFCAIHPDKPSKKVTMMLCPRGVCGWGENCILNK